MVICGAHCYNVLVSHQIWRTEKVACVLLNKWHRFAVLEIAFTLIEKYTKAKKHIEKEATSCRKLYRVLCAGRITRRCG